MPFSLKIVPTTFQSLMELALFGFQFMVYLIYINNIILYGQDFNEHMQQLVMVFQKFCKVGLKLKPSKCHLFKTQVTFLRHKLTPEGILPDPKNAQKVIEWPTPQGMTEVCEILGMGHYYLRFI